MYKPPESVNVLRRRFHQSRGQTETSGLSQPQALMHRGGGGGWAQVAGRSGGALTWADASIRAADSCTSVSASLRRISSNRCSVEAACHQGGKRGRGFSGGSFRPQWAEGGCIP